MIFKGIAFSGDAIHVHTKRLLNNNFDQTIMFVVCHYVTTNAKMKRMKEACIARKIT